MGLLNYTTSVSVHKTLELPCEIGDTIFNIYRDKIHTSVVHCISIDMIGIYIHSIGSDDINQNENYQFIITLFGKEKVTHIGETVFFTKEEAGEALNKS